LHRSKEPPRNALICRADGFRHAMILPPIS
jgi:hypothetical protein